uniref:Uncharacterized protein n=1 Tax=Cryptomonas curvata TaxID=233186 RepID=A0A7S0M5W3_9CRYP
MERSEWSQALLPMMHVRGGKIIAPHPRHTEKNWSPFVIGDDLYFTYSTKPHIVMHCDWERKSGLLKCEVVQNVTSYVHEAVPHLRGDIELRGSSTAVSLTKDSSDFVALGHVHSYAWKEHYKFFFYRFSGTGPPFRLTGFSPLFTLPLPAGSGHNGHYAHGLCLQSRDLLITYGVHDDTSWYVKVPANRIVSLFDGSNLGEAQSEPFFLLTQKEPKEFPTDLFGKDMYSNLLEMEGSLRKSGHSIAAQYSAFLQDLEVMSIQQYADEARKYRRLWLQAMSKVEQQEQQCADESSRAALSGGGACLSPLEAQRAEDDAKCASWAYFSLLIHENRVLGKLDRRPLEQTVENEPAQDDHGSYDFAGHESVSPAGGPGARDVDRPKLTEHSPSVDRDSRPGMSYDEALRRAMSGSLDGAVLEALRLEHMRAEREGPGSRTAQAKINLGVALMQHANSLNYEEAYKPLYQESEEVLSAAVELEPGNEVAKRNLAAVRRNRAERAQHAQQASRAPRRPCHGGSPVPAYS